MSEQTGERCQQSFFYFLNVLQTCIGFTGFYQCKVKDERQKAKGIPFFFVFLHLRWLELTFIFLCRPLPALPQKNELFDLFFIDFVPPERANNCKNLPKPFWKISIYGLRSAKDFE